MIGSRPPGGGSLYKDVVYRYYDYVFHKEILNLNPGELHACAEELFLATVLGSCVAVVLYEPHRRIGGMNHFLLPGNRGFSPAGASGPTYGVEALPSLLRALERLGAERKKLRCYIFGGGNVLSPAERSAALNPAIGGMNVDFAREYLREMGMSLSGEDTGRHVARKILFSPVTGTIYLKHLSRELLASLKNGETAAAAPQEPSTGPDPGPRGFTLFEPGA
jgi:chemotaxis protein CheD